MGSVTLLKSHSTSQERKRTWTKWIAGKFDPYDSVIPSLDQLLAIPIGLQKRKKTKAKGEISTQHHYVLTTTLQVYLLRKHLLRRHQKKEGQNW